MKSILRSTALFFVCSSFAIAQGAAPARAGSVSHAGFLATAGQVASLGGNSATQAGPDLKTVLAEMNKAAAAFKSAQADFEWDQYTDIVKEHDVQKGQIFFRRTKNGIDAAVNVRSPEPKQVTFVDGQLKLYQPRIDQVTVYKAGANRADVESFMSLGFGASGDSLARNFDIKLEGWETVDGVKTAKLELTPKNDKVKSSINRILLWVDPQQAISLKQQFFEPSGDYRLTHYTNIKVNGNISDKEFRLNTKSTTKVVQPQ